jgi:hypothetical protein
MQHVHVLAGPLDAHQLDKYTGRRCYLSPTSLRRGEMIELLPGVPDSPLSVFLCKAELYECPGEAIAAALPAQSKIMRQEKLVQTR